MPSDRTLIMNKSMCSWMFLPLNYGWSIQFVIQSLHTITQTDQWRVRNCDLWRYVRKFCLMQWKKAKKKKQNNPKCNKNDSLLYPRRKIKFIQNQIHFFAEPSMRFMIRNICLLRLPQSLKLQIPMYIWGMQEGLQKQHNHSHLNSFLSRDFSF